MTIRNIDVVFDEAKRFKRENRRNYERNNTRKSPGKDRSPRGTGPASAWHQGHETEVTAAHMKILRGPGLAVTPRRSLASRIRLGGGDARGRRAGELLLVSRVGGRGCGADPCRRGESSRELRLPAAV